MRKWLFDLRIENGITQEKLAGLSQISRVQYSRIEKQTRNPSVKVAKKIADILSFDWTKFFEAK